MAPRGFVPFPYSPNPPIHPRFDTPIRRLRSFLSPPRHRPAVAVVAAVIIFLLFLVVTDSGAAARVGGRPHALRPLDFSESWETVFNESRAGWHAVPSSSTASEPLQHGPTRKSELSEECLEAWVAEGYLCPALVGAYKGLGYIDVLLPWTNGSDRLLWTWRELLESGQAKARRDLEARAVGRLRQPGRRPSTKEETDMEYLRQAKLRFDTIRHFREHDELRFSLRSLSKAFTPHSVSKVHLVTADLPVGFFPTSKIPFTTPTSLERVGQAPTWLDVGAAQRPIPGRPALQLAHHSQIFLPSTPELASDWIKGSAPSFNSMAIEAQMPYIKGLAEHVLYSNDDVFFTAPLSSTDFATPLTGPVFRIQRDLLVQGVETGKEAGDPEGEWPGLRHANWLLEQRFGKRNRGYLAHIAKSLPTEIWREMRQLWGDELQMTSESRFRGRKQEFQTPFLVTHYTIERHREALLASYIIAKSDVNHDGTIDGSERKAILRDLGFDLEDGVTVPLPRRSTIRNLPSHLASAGLELALATETQFSSQDGFAMLVPTYVTDQPRRRNEWPVKPSLSPTDGIVSETACRLERLTCFGENKAQSVATFFRRLAYEQPGCGDCIVALLVNKSGPRGLSAFLPPADDAPSAPLIPLFSNSKTFADLDSTSTPYSRSQMLHLIHRYRYTIGESDTQFISLRQSVGVINSLSDISPGFAKAYHHASRNKTPAIVTLNDDMRPSSADYIREAMAVYFKTEWPDPSPFERAL